MSARSFKITYRLLLALNACPEERRKFKRLFPNGVTVSTDEESNFEKAILAAERGLNLVWVLDRLVDGWREGFRYCNCHACQSNTPSSIKAPDYKSPEEPFFAACMIAANIDKLSEGEKKCLKAGRR